MHFISFSFSLRMAKLFHAVLNSNGQSGQPCPIPDLREETLGLSPLGILAVGFP